jgi:hypothetical protein
MSLTVESLCGVSADKLRKIPSFTEIVNIFSEPTLYRKAKAGKLRTVKLGGSIFTTEDWMKDFLLAEKDPVVTPRMAKARAAFDAIGRKPNAK